MLYLSIINKNIKNALDGETTSSGGFTTGLLASGLCYTPSIDSEMTPTRHLPRQTGFPAGLIYAKTFQDAGQARKT
ncbi:MAG: hypothetical protein NZP74_08420 [Anaerolineales bacterium]|nr:hypothetical protein [Anaerolineales bacterium]MDW8279295.1 hypothetical protein [Anaerolineales bacterium]